MSDIFREVEEDVRRERLEKFWKRYSALLITLGALLLAGVGGWQLMKRHGATIAVRDSEAFAGAQRITNPTEAAKAFGTLAQNAGRETSMFAPLYKTLRPVTNPGGNGYALVAKMAQAGALFASGQLKSAVDLYREVGQSDDGEIGRAARLRAAWIIHAQDERVRVVRPRHRLRCPVGQQPAKQRGGDSILIPRLSRIERERSDRPRATAVRAITVA